jgi:hypothetical protein
MDEVKKEAVFVAEISREKAQGVSNALENFGRFSESAVISDAQAGEAKSGGGNAGKIASVVAVGQGAVFYLTRSGAGFSPEKVEGSLLDFVEKALVAALVWRTCGLDHRLSTGGTRQKHRWKRCGAHRSTAETQEVATRMNTTLAHCRFALIG